MKSGFGKNNFSHVYIHEPESNTMNNASRQIASQSNGSYGQIIHRRMPNSKPRRMRRDQRAVCFAARAASRSYASRRRPCCFSNRALVTSFAWCGTVGASDSVCGPVAGVALQLRSAKRSTCPARRPQTEARVYRRGGRDTRRDSACCSNNSRVRPTSAASADSLGNTVWYSRTSILFPNPSIA